MIRTALLGLVVGIASACGGSPGSCKIAVDSIGAETMNGQVVVTGDFSGGQPIMVLSVSSGSNYIACTVSPGAVTATCNLGGLVSLGDYMLAFDVSCNNDADDGTVDNQAGDTYQVVY